MNSQLVVAIIGVEPAEAGGAHNAETLMVEQIRKSLEIRQVILFSPQERKIASHELLKRLKGFLRLLYYRWKANPFTWSLTRRFTWIPTSKFERSLLKKKVDLVFFVGPCDRAVELKRIPFIVTIWDLGHRDLPSLPEMSCDREFELREWTIRNIAMKATAIMVDSEITRDKLQAFYGIDKSRIHSLPFIPKVESVIHQVERENFALYPAHYWSHKNHIVLFRAIAKLLSEGKKPRTLRLTGLDRGNLEFLIDKTKELGIVDFVEFLGFIPQSELYSLYHRAAVVVMPSLLGPTNIPPLESLLRGCPVAVTPSARANLGNWTGVIEVDGSDISAWSELLTESSKLPEVDFTFIRSQLSEISESNLVKLNSIFRNFDSMKNTYA